MTPVTNKCSSCLLSSSPAAAAACCLQVSEEQRADGSREPHVCLEASEHRFKFGMIGMGFILMPKSLNHPTCLGSQSYNAKDLLYYGGQM